MKKRISILLSLLVVSTFLLTACGGSKKPQINVYNWGDFIDKSVLDDFQKETGIKVNYSTYVTNEDLYVKLKKGGGNYDVVFPSDYMIEKMIKEDMLLELNKENIPNMKNIGDSFMDLEFDPDNKYSVPYMWGTVGIIYNKEKVKEPVDSWDILWDEKYKDEIIMLNSQRDALAVALLKLGYSMNTRDLGELEEAKEELLRQKPLVYAYQGDEVKDTMISEDAALAVVWSGDAVYMMRENPNLDYAIPKEGTNLWFDNVVIPNTAQNKEGAEAFINFLSRPDVAAKNVNYIGYSTPIPEAKELLSEEDKTSPVAYPSDEVIENTEIFKDPADIIKVYDEIWTDIQGK